MKDVKVYIIGSDSPDVVKSFGNNNALVTGYVSKLEPYLDGCNLSIALLRFVWA